MHSFDYSGMLPQAEIIIGTPYRYLTSQPVIKGLREVTGVTFEVGEYPMSVFAPNQLETRFEELIEVHRTIRRLDVGMIQLAPTALYAGEDR